MGSVVAVDSVGPVGSVAGMLCLNLAKIRALCGFHVINFIITELRGLVMCQ